MADSGKQSPLGVNVLGGILQNRGFYINPIAEFYMGVSKTNSDYQFGELVQNTVLRLLTWSINDAYNRSDDEGEVLVSSIIYNKLISLGRDTLPQLGNAKPPTYTIKDDAGVWTVIASKQLGNEAPANSGYAITGSVDTGQAASWLPYNLTNINSAITQWGYIRLHALQAHNEFNWNGDVPELPHPEYSQFLGSYLSAASWVESTNQAVLAVHNSQDFLNGMYSNINDLITADIAGVNSAFLFFGRDLRRLGRSLSLDKLSTFGLPSSFLKTLSANSAITQELSLSLLAAGLTQKEINSIIFENTTSPSVDQERKIYGAFLVIRGNNSENTSNNLVDVLTALGISGSTIVSSSNPEGFESLADLLDVKKLFRLSWQSLTVPIYNEDLSLPSKTYYLIFNSSGGVNYQLSLDPVVESVGTLIPFNGTFSSSDLAKSPDQYSTIPEGFDSYLRGILPADKAIAAGAFSYSMRQIKNIETCNITEFARMVENLELVTLSGPGNLDQLNQANLPTNLQASVDSKKILSQGSGPYNTYTMSDMFGSMSGLPYNWSTLYRLINEVSTKKLENIYNQLFLAVTWQEAPLVMTQPIGFRVVQQFIAPTEAANNPNPDFPGTDPNNPFLNFVTGVPTASPTYYVDGGQPAAYDFDYYNLIEVLEATGMTSVLNTTLALGGGYGRGDAPAPIITINVRDADGNILGPSNTNMFMVAAVGRDDKLARSRNQGQFGRLSFGGHPGTRYVFLENDPGDYTNSADQTWIDKTGEDALNNPPTEPEDVPRSNFFLDSIMPLETFTIESPPIDILAVLENGEISTAGVNVPGAVICRKGIISPSGILIESPQSFPRSAVNQYCDQANKEISQINDDVTSVQRNSLNNIWNQLGNGLTREQRTRFTALGPVDVPKDYFVNPYPTTQVAFVDSLPSLALDTRVHMNVQTLENISDTSSLSGQSVIGMMRQSRNQSRLQGNGIPLDDNIENELSDDDTKTVMVNGTLSGIDAGVASPITGEGEDEFTPPAFPGVASPITGEGEDEFTPPAFPGNDDPNQPGTRIVVVPKYVYVPPGDPGADPGLGVIDDDDDTVISDDDPEILDPPDTTDPKLDTRFLSGILLPGSPSVAAAIEQVIECNCDCWFE